MSGGNTEADTESLIPVHPYPAGEYSSEEDVPPVLRMSTQRDQEVEDDDEKGYGAEHLVSILIPVTITMALVCAVVQILQNSPIQQESQQSYSRIMPFREASTDTTATKMGHAVVNAMAFVGVILGFTVVFFLLYKFRCMKIIYGWLGFSVVMLLGISGAALEVALISEFEITTDWITFIFFTYNFAVVGLMAIFWHAPDIITQGYLVAVSVIMAWVLTKLPEWTNWSVLTALALYDAFAVLSPCGPLKALVELSQERQEPIPGLIYEASPPSRPVNLSAASQQATHVVPVNDPPPRINTPAEEWPAPGGGGPPLDAGAQTQTQPTMANAASDAAIPAYTSSDEERDLEENVMANYASEPEVATAGANAYSSPSTMISLPDDDDDEEKGIKLGLGDFVFYSVLIGRAAVYGFIPIVCCYIAIVTGLCTTLFLLAALRKPLPALPIPIFLGMMFYFSSRYIGIDFIDTLSFNQL